jgi:hypothetical protein
MYFKLMLYHVASKLSFWIPSSIRHPEERGHLANLDGIIYLLASRNAKSSRRIRWHAKKAVAQSELPRFISRRLEKSEF